jgi:hypothetical protein
MTRQQLIDSLIEAIRAKEAAAKAKAKEVESEATVIPFSFGFGEPVYIKYSTDPEPGVVTEIRMRAGELQYVIMWCNTREETLHYDFELSKWLDTAEAEAEPEPK